MNVERVERVSDFVRDTGSEQRQRVQALGLDRLLFAAPAFSDVTQNDRMSDLVTRYVDLISVVPIRCRLAFDDERHDVEINEPVGWIKNFHVAADRDLTLRKRRPIETAYAFIEAFAERIVGIDAKQMASRVVQIGDSPFRIGDDDSFLDRIENRFE